MKLARIDVTLDDVDETCTPAGHLSVNEVGDWTPYCDLECSAGSAIHYFHRRYHKPEGALATLLDHLAYDHKVQR